MDYIVKAYKDWKLHSQFHEIVPDMDDDYMFNEKQSIRESARSLKKYGSTCCNHNTRNNETLIRHDIDKTDTLQGIALRYGCTTEQIRRANRLFASDSLFLRQFLLIPVDKTSPFYPKTEDANDSSGHTTVTNGNGIHTPTAAEAATTTADATTTATTTAIPLTTDIEHIMNGVSTSSHVRSNGLPTRPYSIAGELLLSLHDDISNGDDNCVNGGDGGGGGIGGGSSCSGNNAAGNSNKQSKSLDSVVAMTPDEENRKCINEFLSKIDSTILESRKYVEKSKKERMTSQSDDDLFGTTDAVQRRRHNNHLNNSYKKNSGISGSGSGSNNQSHMRQSSTGSNSDTAQLLSSTQTRRVQNSLKRLEKQQDEFFEL